MRPGNPQLNEALNSGQRHYTMQARLGGKDVTDQVDAWSVDRKLSGGLPDQVALTTGGGAAEARITLSGDEGQTAAQRYSPWAPRSTADITRQGQSAVVSWGLAGENLQALRGRVRSVSADSRAGTAEVTALDGAEAMRGDAWLPPLISRGETSTSSYFAGVPWLMDHIARQCGFHNSPPARENSIFFASMNRGFAPNIGGLVSYGGANRFLRDQSPWSAGPAAPPGSRWSATYTPQRRVLSQVTTLMIDWWVLMGPNGVTTTSRVELNFGNSPNNQNAGSASMNFDPGVWRLRSGQGASTISWMIPESVWADGRVRITWVLRLRGTAEPMESQVWVTTEAGQWQSPVDQREAPGWGWLMAILVESGEPMECVNVSRLIGTVPVRQEWRRTASIMPDVADVGVEGAYALHAFPEPGGSWWDLVTEVADAHRLHAGFDEDGVFRVSERQYFDIEGPQVPEPDLTVTSARELDQVTTTEEADQIANVIRASTNMYDPAGPDEDWYRGGVTSISAGGQHIFVIDEEERERPWGLVTPYLYNTGGDGAADVPRVKCLTATGTIAPVEVELIYGPQLQVIVYNRGTSTAWVATTTDRTLGSLVITRREVSTSAAPLALAMDGSSINRYGRRVLDVSASEWVQLRYQALVMARQLLDWTRAPIPLAGDLGVLPDPRIQIGDVVRVEDPTGSMVDGLFRVLGVRVEGRGGAVTQRITVRPLYRPAAPVDAGLVMEPITDPDAAPIITG